MFNLAVGYVLVARVGRFELRQTKHVVVLGLEILVMALMLAWARKVSWRQPLMERLLAHPQVAAYVQWKKERGRK